MRIGILSSVVPVAVLVAPAMLLGQLPGCGVCSEEVVRARMNGEVAVNGVARAVSLDDRASPNIAGTYSTFRATVLDASGIAAAAGGIAWTFQSIPGEPAHWSFGIDTPVTEGETIPVRVHRPVRHGGLWGVLLQGAFPEGERAFADLVLDDFSAARVEGSLLVLDASPLALRADLRFASVDGDTTVRITGDVVFDVIRQRVACD
jgi:hypothetical protein